jgi:hypothetical protein
MPSSNNWRLPRLLLAIAGVVFLVALTTQSGHAGPGSTPDPDDVTGKLDVSTLAHNDSGTEIIYTVTTYDDFVVGDAFTSNWTLQNASGVTFANVVASSNGSAFAGEVLDPAGNHIADATVTHPSAKSLVVKYYRGALGNITSYKYGFSINTSAATDYVPDDGTNSIEHNNLAAVQTTTTGAPTTTSTTTGGSGSGATTTSTTTTSTTTASTTTSTTTGGSGSGNSTTSTTAAGGGGTTTTTACSPKLVADPTNVAPKQSVKLTGTCLARNTDDTIVLTSNPVLLGTVHTDGNGNFTASFVIPANTSPGTHTITASGGGTAAAATITVGPKSLSFTGRNAGRAIGVAAALVFAGMVLVAGRMLGDHQDDYIREL